MSETLNETSTENAAEGKKGGKKKLIIIALILVLLGGSAGGGFYYWRKASAAEPVAEETEEEAKPKSKKKSADAEGEEKDTSAKEEAKKSGDALSNALPDDEDVTKIIELEPFIVNLADTEQARYLRMTVSLGVAGEGEEEKPNQLFVTRVRNVMLAVLSDKQSEQILTVGGKAKLRAELLKAAQAASEEPEVKAIYITDFIVQL